jgi:hypothetical protein
MVISAFVETNPQTVLFGSPGITLPSEGHEVGAGLQSDVVITPKAEVAVHFSVNTRRTSIQVSTRHNDQFST